MLRAYGTFFVKLRFFYQNCIADAKFLVFIQILSAKRNGRSLLALEDEYENNTLKKYTGFIKRIKIKKQMISE